MQEQIIEKQIYKEGMINIPAEELLDKAGGSIFKLCNLAAKRALELNEGSPRLIAENYSKITTSALEEIRQGRVRLGEKKAKVSSEEE